MTQRPFLGAGDVTSLPGFGKLSDEEITEMKRRDVLEKTRAQQKQIAGLDITGIDFEDTAKKKKKSELSDFLRRRQESALWLEHPTPEPKVVDVRGPEYKGPISPMGLFSIEAETMGVIASERSYHLSSNPIDLMFNGYKLGQDMGLIGKPKGSTVTAVKSLNPFSSAFNVKEIEDNLNLIKEAHEERPVKEQLLMGLSVPTNLVPVSIGTKAAKGGIKQTMSIAPHLKANSNQEVFKAILENVPQVLEETPDLATAYRRGGDELLVQIMNKPVNIKGIPENSLYESDLRLWLDMRTTPMNIDAFGDEMVDAVSRGGLEESLERLVDLGLVTKRGSNLGRGEAVYTRAMSLDSPESMGILKEMGLDIGDSGAVLGNDFVFNIKSFNEQLDTINTFDNAAAAKLAKATGINPSLGARTPMEKAVIASARQNSSADQLVEISLQAGLDSKAEKFTGRIPVKIDKDGVVKGTGMLWQDVFSIPNLDELKKFKIKNPITRQETDALSDEAIEYINRYRQIVDETEKLRVQNGLPSLSKDRDGWLYIPRQVTSIDDVELLSRSSAHQERFWDLATDARMGRMDEETGELIEHIYDIDPRLTLQGHMKTAYREIVDSQLSEYMAENVTSFTKAELIEKLNPKLAARSNQAINDMRRAKANLKNANKNLQQAQTDITTEFIFNEKTGKFTKKPGVKKLAQEAQEKLAEINRLQQEVQKATDEFGKTRADFNNVRGERARALNNIAKDDLLKGKLFGELGENRIPVKMWRGKFYKLDDFKVLDNGVSNVAGESKGWVRNVLGRPADAARWLIANADFGAPLIQGLPLLAQDPVKWTKATLKHYQAFLDPTVQARFVENNIDTFREMAQHGVPVGDVEFFQALERGRGIPIAGVLEMLPQNKGDELLGSVFGESSLKVGRGAAMTGRGIRAVSNQTFGRFQSSYGMFLAYNRALMWDALKPTFTQSGKKGGGLDELGAYIRNLTGGLDSKALGVGSKQREIEGTFLAFSPRLLRSTVSLVSDALMAIPMTATGKGATVRQKESFKTIGQLLTAVHGVAAAAVISHGLSKGHDWDRIMDDVAISQNPLSGKRYLGVEVDGQHYGVGGQVRALTQLMTGMATSIATGDADRFKEMDLRENPILGFMASRGAQGVRVAQTAVEGITGFDANVYEEIEGFTDMFAHLFEDSLPIFVQGWMEGDNIPGRTTGAGGVRTSPSTAADDFNRILEDDFRNQPDEVLEEFGHKRGEVPRNSRDMDTRLMQQLIEENPELQELEVQKGVERREKGSVMQDYKDEKQQAKTTRDTEIENAVAEVGVGQRLRGVIGSQYQEYVDAIEEIDGKSEYSDLVEYFDEQEASTSEYNRALEEYFRALNADPPLDHPIWGHDFKARDERIEALRENPITKGYVDDIEKDIRNNAIKPVQDLNRDRDVMKPYFRVIDEEVAKAGFEEKFEFWKRQSRDDQEDMRNGAVDIIGWTFKDRLELLKIEAKAEEKREAMQTGAVKSIGWTKEDAFLLDALLWKWEYNTTPHNIKFLLLERKFTKQRGGVRLSRRGEIDRYLIEAGLDW